MQVLFDKLFPMSLCFLLLKNFLNKKLTIKQLILQQLQGGELLCSAIVQYGHGESTQKKGGGAPRPSPQKKD